MRISSTYRDLNRDLHRSNPDDGRAAPALAPWVVDFAKQSGVQTLLDYGCGKGTLKPAILAQAPDLIVAEYDPAIPGKDSEPQPCDIVVCIDVLEHEPVQVEVVDSARHVPDVDDVDCIVGVILGQTDGPLAWLMFAKV